MTSSASSTLFHASLPFQEKHPRCARAIKFDLPAGKKRDTEYIPDITVSGIKMVAERKIEGEVESVNRTPL